MHESSARCRPSSLWRQADTVDGSWVTASEATRLPSPIPIDQAGFTAPGWPASLCYGDFDAAAWGRTALSCRRLVARLSSAAGPIQPRLLVELRHVPSRMAR